MLVIDDGKNCKHPILFYVVLYENNYGVPLTDVLEVTPVLFIALFSGSMTKGSNDCFMLPGI